MAAPTRLSPVRLFRGFLREREDPEDFYPHLARRTIDDLPVDVEGRRVLDLGCGAGWFTAALNDAGARGVGIDLDAEDARAARQRADSVMAADGRCLPFPDGSIDVVFCSNMLEHTPDPDAILTEIERVLASGGTAWVSWTLWFSPWGGHAIAPFHYLGARWGLRVRTWLLGAPTGKNLPYVRLWPTHAGQVMGLVRRRPGLRLVDAHPRYWPSQRWILRLPLLREFLAWNCVLVIRRAPR